MPRADRAPLSDVQAAARYVLGSASAADPPLRSRTWRVLAAVLAFTATWTRLEDAVSHDQLGTTSGLAKPSDRRNLSRELHELHERGLIVYRPGTSRAGERRTASVVGLRRPPVGSDQESPPVGSDPRSPLTPGRDVPPVGAADPRSAPALTPGRDGPRPPVGPDPPPLHTPSETPTTNGDAARVADQIADQTQLALDRPAAADAARPCLDDGWQPDALIDHVTTAVTAKRQREPIASPSGFVLALLRARPAPTTPPAPRDTTAAARTWGTRMAALIDPADWPDLLTAQHPHGTPEHDAADAAYHARPQEATA